MRAGPKRRTPCKCWWKCSPREASSTQLPAGSPRRAKASTATGSRPAGRRPDISECRNGVSVPAFIFEIEGGKLRMEPIRDVPKEQEIVEQTLDGRIIVMDSITFADERNNSHDVLVGASFCGVLSIRWPLRVDPKGVIGHAAGPGKDAAGISGLYALEALRIPGAAAETMSCRIADGRDMYENGIVGYLNDSARKLGIVEGMPIREAARRMLQRKRGIGDGYRPVEAASQGDIGRVMAMGSVTFITTANSG